MGQTAENVRELEGVSRREMDEFACLSQNRAVESQENGFFEREITPVTTPGGTVVTKDDGPRDGTTVEKLAALKPVFRPDGSVTAGNACPLNDGAAAVVVMSDTRANELGIKPLARIVATGVSALNPEIMGLGQITAGNACPLNDGAAAVMVMSDTKAKELGLTPLARIIASGVTGLNPEIMGLGPIEACRQALKRAGLTIDDIDLVEINEAFAAQVIPSARHLGIPDDKLNINGGAIALGHPFGMTGARIMTTLIHNLQTEDKTFGMESMCVGGGQGMAMIVERLS